MIRSSSALHKRGFGNTVVHSENGRLVRADICQRHIPDLVERDQLILLPASHHFSDLSLLLGFHQFIDQCSRRDETNTPLLPASRQTKATGTRSEVRRCDCQTLAGVYGQAGDTGRGVTFVWRDLSSGYETRLDGSPRTGLANWDAHSIRGGKAGMAATEPRKMIEEATRHWLG